MTNNEQRIFRLERELQAANELLRQLRDAVAQLKQQQYGLEGGGGGGGGGAPGIFLATPAGSIAAGGTSSEAITQSWDGASVGTHTVRNPYGVATTAGRVLTLGKNPDGSYTIIGQTC
jgi:hypothetical protein